MSRDRDAQRKREHQQQQGGEPDPRDEPRRWCSPTPHRGTAANVEVAVRKGVPVAVSCRPCGSGLTLLRTLDDLRDWTAEHADHH